MCCFTRYVKHVSRTRIFARSLAGGLQSLVYAMDFEIDEAQAMVLPLPVPPRAAEDAVRFVSLERYPRFFDDLDKAFPEAYLPLQRSKSFPMPAAMPQPQLKVHEVGAFEASFVPTPADFERLDPRFRVPPALLEALPRYADYGFAVFKLKPEEAPRRLLGLLPPKSGVARAHPMAFTFPRRDPASLYFPTVHVHDGTVPEKAAFDHTLICQPDPFIAATLGWTPSSGRLRDFVDARRAEGLVDPDAPAYRELVQGARPNADVLLVEPVCAGLSVLRIDGGAFRMRLLATRAYSDGPLQGRDAKSERWAKTARERLDDLSRGLREGLAAIEARHGGDWALAPWDAGLAEHVMNGTWCMRGADLATWQRATPGVPGRVRFLLFNDLVEPQHVDLAFARVPDDAACERINGELKGLLDRVSAGW